MERPYLDHFGLRQAPFSITPDPRFFFEGSGRGDLLRGIHYSVRHQEGIVLVTGEVGSGKTMLCRALLAAASPDITPAYIFNPRLRQREMLQALLRDLGEAPGTDPNGALQNVLLQRYLAGRRVVLFADEAHAMPRESLEQIRLLTNLETGTHKLLQIVLFGQPELIELLDDHAMRPLRDRIVERFTVGAIEPAAASQYIAFRMARAGRETDSGFSREAVSALRAAAGGLIRRINLLADKALLSAFARNRQRVGAADVRRAVADLDGTELTNTTARVTGNQTMTTPSAHSAPLAARALLLAAAGLVAACAPTLPRPSDSHLLKSEVPEAPPQIPAPARGTLDLAPPVARPEAERFTVVVNAMPAAELLFALARDARVNVDVHPDIAGVVSINAIDQTLVQILNRIATQVDMRFTLEGNLLTVVPDTPFVRIYRVDYLNMGRDTTSRTSIATQVSTTGGVGDAKGTESASGNNSNAEIVNSSRNQFWETLVDSLKAMLQETDKILPGVDENAAVADDTRQTANVRFREAASVMAQPETGVVAVRATSRQHERVQEFLDSSLSSARRQVLIEATIAEVELADGYEQGIDWQALRTGTETAIGFTLRPAGFLTQLPGGSPVGSTPPTLGLLEVDHSAGKFDIMSALRLLQSFGNTRVLSSPKISVLNNQTALIKVVDNIVYFQLTTDYTPGTAGSPTTFTVTSTPNTVPVGFLMNVTPQISSGNEVVLNLRPTISRLTGYVEDPGVALSLALARQAGTDIPDVSSRVPEIQTREMESVIKVSDGQIAVLGGLMREETSDGEDAVPGVAKLPGVGNLFRNRSRHTKKSELVIFLRPVIVREPSLEGDYRGLAGLLPDDAFLGASVTR